MSETRAPVACTICGSGKTVVAKLTVEHSKDSEGVAIPQRLVYKIHCPDCSSDFTLELPADDELPTL